MQPQQPQTSQPSQSDDLRANLQRLESIQRVLASARTESREIDDQLTIKKYQLDKAVREHTEVMATFKDEESKYLDKIKKLKVESGETLVGINKLKDEMREGSKALRALKGDLSDIKEQLRDRRAYLNEQEALIETTLSEGNQQLATRLQEVEVAQKEKESLLRDTINLRKDKERAEQEAAAAIAKVGPLERKYTETAETFKFSLSELKKQVDEAAANLRETNMQAEYRLKAADIRERQVAEREKAAADQEKDLRKRELRYQRNKAIYNM